MDDPSEPPPPPRAEPSAAPWAPPVVDASSLPTDSDSPGRSDTPRRILAAAVGSAAVALFVLLGVIEGRSGWNLVGYGLGALLFPTIAFGSFAAKGARARVTAFTVVAGGVVAVVLIGLLGRVGDEPDRAEQAAELMAALGSWPLGSPAGACLVDGVVAFDDASFAELGRSAAPPGEAVAGRLRDLVVECGVDRLIVAGFIDGVRVDPDASTAPYDLICMREALAKPSVALFHTTMNATMLDLPDSIGDQNIIAVAMFTWRACIDGGALVADSIRLLGGPALRPASIICLGEWFEAEDDRLARLFVGAMTDIEEGLRSCLSDDEVIGYERWATRA